MTKKVMAILPARLGSTRLPEKPLIEIEGKSIIQRTYEQVKKSKKIDFILVATDHQKIAEHVKSFGGNVALTNENHQSGTDRCAEAILQFADNEDFKFVVNVQGDEPFISPKLIDAVVDKLLEGESIVTAAKKIETQEQLFNPNVVKVVLSTSQKALYFSRHPIPYVRDVSENEWLEKAIFYKHIGIYGFRSEILSKIVELPLAPLEAAEKLEQLRWLSNGFRIKVVVTEYDSMGIDTEDDLKVQRSGFREQ